MCENDFQLILNNCRIGSTGSEKLTPIPQT